MGKHLIIAGHGKQKNNTFDPGAIGLIKKGEHKYVVEDLFPAIKKHLPKGHDVVFFSDYKVSNYGNIVSLAKKYGATQVTEIHYDAATPTARNGHVIIHKSYSPDKTDLALRDAIKNITGVRYSHKGHDGISGRDNLYNVNSMRGTGISYRLIELGFGTNKTDADILVNKVDEYGKELVKAITGKVSSKPSASKPAAKPSKPNVKAKPSKPKANLKIDGYEGPLTIKAEQRYFGTPVDGVISKPSTVVKARQRMLDVKADGYPGPITIRAEQRRYGTPVDGKISKPSMMIRERQRRLNKGKL